MESHAARIRWAAEALNVERPLMAERIEVKDSRSILDTYIGEYELTPDFTIVVTRNKRGFYLQAAG